MKANQPARKAPWENLYPDYVDEVNSGAAGMARAYKQMQNSEPGSLARVGSLENMLLGGAQYFGAPLAAPTRSLVSRPLEEIAGIPQEITDTALSALPILGIGKAGSAAKKLEQLEELILQLEGPENLKSLPAPVQNLALPAPKTVPLFPKQESFLSLPLPENKLMPLKPKSYPDVEFNVIDPTNQIVEVSRKNDQGSKYSIFIGKDKLTHGYKDGLMSHSIPATNFSLYNEMNDLVDAAKAHPDFSHLVHMPHTVKVKQIPKTNYVKQKNEAQVDTGEVLNQNLRNENLSNFLEPSYIKNKLYHGTDFDLDSFSEKLHDHEDAYFLTSNPQIAEEYGKSIYPVNVQAKNPLIPSTDDMKNIYGFSLTHQNPIIPQYNSNAMKALIYDAKRKGHDSVIIPRINDFGGEGDQILMFDPGKIKSIFNKGNFNPNDPRLLYGLGGAAITPNLLLKNEKK